MNTTKILAFRKPLLMIVWLLAMQDAAFAQNLRETFFSPNGKIEWKAEGEENTAALPANRSSSSSS